VSHGANELSFEVDGFDCAFDEACSLKCGADGLCAMSQLQPAGACLEEEGREHEEVLAAHERDLDIRAPPEHPLQLSHRCYAAKSAAEDDNAHVTSRIVCNSLCGSPAPSGVHHVAGSESIKPWCWSTQTLPRAPLRVTPAP
jgi:hypothetical protein